MATAPDAPHSMPEANTPQRLLVFVFDVCFLVFGVDCSFTKGDRSCCGHVVHQIHSLSFEGDFGERCREVAKIRSVCK